MARDAEIMAAARRKYQRDMDERRALLERRCQEVYARLPRLEELDRELLRMKSFSENCSDKEIGEALGIATASVRQYLTNAKRALRKELDKNAQK